jgi:glucitol operon activator protein
MMGWTVLVGLLAVMWALQMFLAYRQAKVFMARVRELRGLGRTAVGVSSQSRFKRRVYVALAVGDDQRVVGAVKISGLTVWARPRAADGLCGRTLDDLVADERTDLARAAAMAARTLRDAAENDAAADLPEAPADVSSEEAPRPPALARSDGLPRPLHEAEEVTSPG